jgi:glycosyltransferase involved in cell wall biosynthesis
MAAVSLHEQPLVNSIPERRRPLRILLSAYACEPNRGSEPGIGWQWATRLAESGHEVVVLTRANNSAAIAKALAVRNIPRLEFVYFDLPRWARFWKRGGSGVHLYYILWQWLSFPTAYRLHRRKRFDVVHHLTFGVYRQPSWLALLDAPCIFGPVGGGEYAPHSLRRGLPLAARGREWLRDLANGYARIDPLLRFALRHTAAILCKTEETRDRMPRRYRDHCALFLEIGADPSAIQPRLGSVSKPQCSALNVLYVGRLIHAKGLHLAFPAFAEFLKSFPDSKFTIVGSGPQEEELRELCAQLLIDDCVEWIPWMPHDNVLSKYADNDVFLFPSLHDSSGNAVLEAMTNGLPVICLKLGGPAAIVDSFSGIRIDAADHDTVIQHLAGALTLLAGNPMLRAFLSRGAYARANNYFSWRAQVERMTTLYYALQGPSASELHR